MSPRSIPFLIALALAATPGLAEDAAPLAAMRAAPPPERTSSLVVYGNDPCPRGRGDEIVVCAHRPESERYRLPKRFREGPPTVAQGSWTNRAEALDQISRAGLPDSCTPIGSNGQTGCFHQFIAQANAERRQDKAEAAAIP